MPTPEITATVSEAKRLTMLAEGFERLCFILRVSNVITDEHREAIYTAAGFPENLDIPGEAQATREGEKELKWGCKLLPSKTGISGKGVYSPSGKFYLYGLSPSHSWAECEKDETYTHFPDDAAALAALNACNTPPPDWKEPESIFDKFDKTIASMSPETLASLPVSQPPQGKTETVIPWPKDLTTLKGKRIKVSGVADWVTVVDATAYGPSGLGIQSADARRGSVDTLSRSLLSIEAMTTQPNPERRRAEEKILGVLRPHAWWHLLLRDEQEAVLSGLTAALSQPRSRLDEVTRERTSMTRVAVEKELELRQLRLSNERMERAISFCSGSCAAHLKALKNPPESGSEVSP